MSLRRTCLAVAGSALLGGASSAMAQLVPVIPPAPAQVPVVVAPAPPPPAPVETIPPPPSAQAQVMTWRPGHWVWDGANWSWVAGQYAERPTPQTRWEPGHWEQQSSGGYVWVDGRWKG